MTNVQETSSRTRYRKTNRKAVRFSESPLTVYDLETWDPLEDYVETEFIEEELDLDFVVKMGSSIGDIRNEFGITATSPLPSARVEGEEVGDDRVDYTLDPLRACACLMAQTDVIRMVTSNPDTNLSTTLWNFCEVTSVVPLHPDQSFDRCRKVGEFHDLGFIDVPPLRIILDVAKGDRSHSSTAVGKAAMLGTRMRTPRTEFLSDFHLASYLQDGYLRTSRSPEPKYLPQIMGGSGCRALFGEPTNLHLSVYAYRNGRCQRIYGSATRELRQSLDSLERGKVIMPILCRRLRDRQEYLHGTYAEKVFIPSKAYIDTFGRKLPPPLITASGGSNLFTNFENRLLRTRHLVTRTGAEREWELTTRIRSSLLSRTKSVTVSNDELAYAKKAARREFGDALNANTALSNLLERKGSLQDVIQLTNDNFHVVNCGATHFTKWDAEWLFFGGKSDNFSIEDLTSSEDLFVRKEVSEDESLKVGSILLRPLLERSKRVLTTTTVGMYQIGSGMYEWAEELFGRLVNHRSAIGRPLSRDDALEDYEVNPEWVNDDTLIIGKCLRDTGGRAQRSTTVVLVSDDKRLGNQLANTCNVTVVRVNPRDYILWSYEVRHNPVETPDCAILRSYLDGIKEGHPCEHVYVDTGSVNASLARVDVHQSTGKINLKRPVEAYSDPKTGKRTYRYTLTELEVPEGLRYVTHLPVLKPKRYRVTTSYSAETRARQRTLSRLSSASTKTWRVGM